MDKANIRIAIAAAAACLAFAGHAAPVPAPKITWDNLRQFAQCNADSVGRSVRGIVVFHGGEPGPLPAGWAQDYARQGIVAIRPSAGLADAVVGLVVERLKLPADVPVCSAGRAGGEEAAASFARGSSHNVVSVVTNSCPLPEADAKFELAILNSFPPAGRMACDVPDVLTAADGTRIATAAQWEKVRRPELLKLFLGREYGERPVERPADLSFAPIGEDRVMMDGRALRKRVSISCTGPEGPFSFSATAFVPVSEKPVGAFILICNRNPAENIDPERVVKSGFWPAEEIVARGYAAVAFWNGDVARDDKVGCMTTGVFRAWHRDGARTRRSWGALSAWAWGASRVLDWLETVPQIDARRVAVVGHSRGGKTALLAGVTDTRFALACVNDSGCSGAKLNRANLPRSESIKVITSAFPHWFCLDYASCAGRDFELDFDQHEMVALMAPRAVAIASASEDDWAGQRGEYCSAALASPVWRLYGLRGLEPSGNPAPGEARQDGNVSYHIRVGKHNLTLEDWNRYMDFADRVFPAQRR